MTFTHADCTAAARVRPRRCHQQAMAPRFAARQRRWPPQPRWFWHRAEWPNRHGEGHSWVAGEASRWWSRGEGVSLLPSGFSSNNLSVASDDPDDPCVGGHRTVCRCCKCYCEQWCLSLFRLVGPSCKRSPNASFCRPIYYGNGCLVTFRWQKTVSAKRKSPVLTWLISTLIIIEELRAINW